MGKASRLFLATAGAASLVIACSIPWQDAENIDVSPPEGDLSMISASSTGPTRTVPPAGGAPEVDEPVPAPEFARLAPRIALGPPQKEAPYLTDRVWLGRELQRELSRVGCYEGELNGMWTPAMRKAMKAFTDRVNAALPIDEPDYILLTLVRGHKDKVCNVTCPAGQGFAEGGQCVPNAILAAKKLPQVTRAAPLRSNPAPAGTGGSITRTPAPAVPPSAADEERMGLAGPAVPKNPAPVDGQVPLGAAALNPTPPAPTAARRAVARPTGFNPASFFKQLGF